jgi:hypothetical protein
MWKQSENQILRAIIVLKAIMQCVICARPVLAILLGLVEGGPSFDGASGYEDTITGLCSPDWQDELSGFPVRA